MSIISVAYIGLLVLQLSTGTDNRLVAMGAFVGLLVCWVLLCRVVARDERKGYWIGAVFALAIVISVVFEPATSNDSNAYALYGRMVSEYDISPYLHIPRDVASDPWFPRTSLFWSDSPSVYGPVFTAVSAAVTWVAGDSFLAARLGFQVLAAGSLLASVAMLARRIGRSRAIVFVGLNPLLLTFGVNDAHCDLMIGLGVLAAVLALERRWFVGAGAALALAAMVKISALPAVAGACVWVYFRYGISNVLRVGGTAVLLIASGLLAAGGRDAIEPLLQAGGRHTRFSIWNPLHDVVTSITGSGIPTHTFADRVASAAAGLTIVVVALWLIWRHRRDASAAVIVVIGLVVYQVLGAYTLSWYAAWSLPALALMPRSRTAFVAMAHGSWVAIAYLSGYGVLVVTVAAVAWWLVKRPSTISLTE
jgi:hypothetical protein